MTVTFAVIAAASVVSACAAGYPSVPTSVSSLVAGATEAAGSVTTVSTVSTTTLTTTDTTTDAAAATTLTAPPSTVTVAPQTITLPHTVTAAPKTITAPATTASPITVTVAATSSADATDDPATSAPAEQGLAAAVPAGIVASCQTGDPLMASTDALVCTPSPHPEDLRVWQFADTDSMNAAFDYLTQEIDPTSFVGDCINTFDGEGIFKIAGQDAGKMSCPDNVPSSYSGPQGPQFVWTNWNTNVLAAMFDYSWHPSEDRQWWNLNGGATSR